MFKIICLIISILLMSCSSKIPQKPASKDKITARPQETVSVESKLLANELESSWVTEIKFDRQTANISGKDRDHLKELHNKALKKGQIEEIKVISWGDQEYPSVHEKKLSEEQEKLVEKRNATLKNYLKTIEDKAEVETISMASRPSTLNKWFSSDDARIKKSLETAGIPNTDTTVKVPGKASKSIVIFIMEEE